MSLIARGQGLRKLATSGFRRASEIEAQDVRQAQALEAAKEAQEAQTYGTGAGIGAMYGIKNLPASSGGTSMLVNQPTSYSNMMSPAENPLREALGSAIGSPKSAAINYSPADSITTISGASDVVGATEGVTTALAEGSSAVATGTVGSSSAGGSGLMANIGSIAAPVAIGLGVAFLLNKLFD